MTREEAYKTIKENLCAMCAYGSQCMESCDIRSCDNRDAIKALEQEPTTKNDLPHCQHTDEEIAKSFIEDVEAVKDQLPCFCEQMNFPNTFDEFAKDYGFKDKEEIYTNGSELIQVFRVKQWLEHISTTKNDLGVDCISRADAIKAMQNKAKKLKNEDTINGLCGAVAILYELPSVTPQKPQTFKWCDTCKEYDQEKHCCHRWSKVIRDTVEEMKQEYIEREVLDKIRAEIEQIRNDPLFNVASNEVLIAVVLEIINKYKSDRSVEE